MDRFGKSHFPKTLAYIFVNREVKFDLVTLLQRAQARLELPDFLFVLFVMPASRRFYMAAKFATTQRLHSPSIRRSSTCCLRCCGRCSRKF